MSLVRRRSWTDLSLNSGFAGYVLLANAISWFVFAVLLIVQSHPYAPHRPYFEEPTPSYIFLGRAVGQIDSGTGGTLPSSLMKVIRGVQTPSFVAARPYFWYFNRHGITVDHLYRGLSIGGYYLIQVCLLSFVQWYLICLPIDYVKRRLIGKDQGSSSEQRSKP